jgi:hypothetical protein
MSTIFLWGKMAKAENQIVIHTGPELRIRIKAAAARDLLNLSTWCRRVLERQVLEDEKTAAPAPRTWLEKE